MKKMPFTFTFFALSIGLAAAGASPAALAAAEGCKKGDTLYYFGYVDWKAKGTGWTARERDFAGDPAGLSVFVNLSPTQYRAMNAVRVNDNTAMNKAPDVVSEKRKSVVLQVPCDALSNHLSVVSDPTKKDDKNPHWTDLGRSQHAVLNGTKGGRYDEGRFNKEFSNLLIDKSVVVDTTQKTPQ